MLAREQACRFLRMRVLLFALAAWPLAVSAAQTDRAADAHRIARLIQQLGHKEFARREAAGRELMAIGEAALPALKEAGESDDPEVALRARRTYQALVHPDAQTQKKLREEAKRALEAGDYEGMERVCRRLALASNASLEDRLLRGHACFLKGDWREAVTAYEKALATLDDRSRRAELLALIAKIQRGMLGDAAAAIATLETLMDHALLRLSTGDLLRHREQVLGGRGERPALSDRRALLEPLRAMRERARAQEQAGKLADAVETLSRVALLRVTHGVRDLPDDVAWLGRLVQELPAGTPPPLAGVLTVLTPQRPSVSFALGDVRALARTHGFALVGPSNPNWVYFAVGPAPGLEFRSVTLRLDGPKVAFPLYCSVVAAGKDGAPGFLTNAQGRHALPPGTGIFRVSFAPKSPRAKGQRLHLAAQFRPRAARAADDGPWSGASTRRQVERQRPKSPFVWHETQLRHFTNYEASLLASHAHLARLPDGRWLLAYGTGPRRERRIMTSTSRDLIHWEPPRRLPMTELFHGDAPALLASEDGTVWLAYLCDPLRVGAAGLAQAWLTSTRDGRAWSPPRPILGASVDSWLAPHPVQMLRAPDGRYWAFHGRSAGRGASLADIRRLEKLRMPWAGEFLHRDPFFAIDGTGRFHVVFSDFRRGGLMHSHSADGRTWGKPVLLVPRERGQDLRRSQLLLRGDRVALIYRGGRSHIEWLRRGRLGPDGLKLGEPQAITHVLARLNGMRVHVTPEGEVLALAGRDRVWLLRAKLAEILGLGTGAF